MPNILDDLMEPEVKPSARPLAVTVPPVRSPASGGNFLDSLMEPAPGLPTTRPIGSTIAAQPEQPSWWDRYGRDIEAAAGVGLAAVLGGKIVGPGLKLLEKSGAPGEALIKGGKNIQAILAPSQVDASAGRAAENTRIQTGTAAREIATAEDRLTPFWKAIGGADDTTQRGFISYVENRSKGAVLDNPELQPLADEMRALYDEVHVDMGKLNQTQKAGFIQDYYRHHWVRDEKSDNVFTKEGGSSFMKQRSIPTIEDGIKQGLTPKTLDPVQTTLEYITNARQFISANNIIAEGRKTGDVISRQMGTKAPFPTDDTWIPLEGRLAKKGGHQLYAKEGWARVYNNWRSPGFTGAAGDVVQAMRRTSNTITGLELGLSGFHFTTMVNEAIVNDVAKAVEQVAKGRFGEAAKSIALSPTAPYRLYKKGRELEDVYLGRNRGSAEIKQMTDLLTQAGGRAKGMMHAKDYEYTAMGNFIDAFKRGTVKKQFGEYGDMIKEAPLSGTVKAASSVVGRTMQSIMYPLFNKYIPRVKNGAFFDTMGDWIKANPDAPKAAQIAKAQEIWDSIDNRFGESVNDNIFWKQHMKQVAMLAMRSYSWNVGTVREIGGGVKDIATQKLTPRAAYVIALPIVYGTIGALYQKLKTGEAPKDMDDLIAPRTGGTDPGTGMPERMIMPGYMKDVFGWYRDPAELAKHKLSTFITTIMEGVKGEDWRGAPIAPPVDDPNAPWEQTVPPWLSAYFGHVGSKMIPISAKDIINGPKVGSNITFPERMLGMQSGGRKYTDPEGMKAYERYRKLKNWRSKEAFDARQESYYGGVE